MRYVNDMNRQIGTRVNLGIEFVLLNCHIGDDDDDDDGDAYIIISGLPDMRSTLGVSVRYQQS